MSRLGRSAITLVFLSLSACLPPIPGPGTKDLPVPYHEQENYYFCVPAAVQMWRHYKHVFPRWRDTRRRGESGRRKRGSFELCARHGGWLL